MRRQILERLCNTYKRVGQNILASCLHTNGAKLDSLVILICSNSAYAAKPFLMPSSQHQISAMQSGVSAQCNTLQVSSTSYIAYPHCEHNLWSMVDDGQYSASLAGCDGCTLLAQTHQVLHTVLGKLPLVGCFDTSAWTISLSSTYVIALMSAWPWMRQSRKSSRALHGC